jgi:CelD/BcsL family acetyltransferase involved in cellulose biosynthesis
MSAPPASRAPEPPRPEALPGLTASVVHDLADEALWTRWAELAADRATPFQTTAFARPLLTGLTPAMGAEPFVVEVRDAGRHVLSLGLCRRPGLLTRIEFPDFGLVDLAAPVWRRGADFAGPRAAELRRVILDALPRHDALLLAKLPATIGGDRNPLADWPGVTEMNVVTMVFDPARRPVADLSAVKESGRKRRRLAREGGAIRRVDELERARELLDFLFAQRDEKARRDGRRETLEHPEVRAFYRELVEAGLPTGVVRIWEVVLGERIIAAVLGLAHAGLFNGTLMATVEEEGIATHSPGMLAVATVLEDHVATGGTLFDLGPGEHPY